MSYMGIDIGQTGTKALVFDNKGNQIAYFYREYETLFPREGWAELDSKRVMESCFEVIKEANTACKNNPVKAVAISSQGEAFTPVDKDGNILYNAMITSDIRSSTVLKKCTQELGSRKLYEKTGHTPHTMFSLFKLLWLKENEPEIFNKTWKFLCFEDLLQFSLGLNPHISWPLAARTMIFNIKQHKWDEEILNYAGISKDKLAVPVPSGIVVGNIKSNIAKSLGFKEKVNVVTAGHDQPVGALGAGVVEEGIAMYAIGTSEAVVPVFPTPVLSDKLYSSNLCTYDYTIEGLYTTVAFSLTGASILKWFRDEFGYEEVELSRKTGKNPYEIILEKIPKDPTRLLVLPYFTPSGTPYFDSDVSGAIFGLRLSTTREEICRALLEGVAYEIKLNLDILNETGIKIRGLIAIGGGAKSDIWLQLKADVLNKQITKVKVTEAASLGAAMLAFAADQKKDIKTIIKEWVKIDKTINPITENGNFYNEQFKKYKGLYKLLKEIDL